MAPVRLALLGDAAARVPVIDEPFWIGRDPGCDLCLWDLRVSRKHARLARTRGEYILTSEGRHGIWVNGQKVPLWSLRHGDRIDLMPPDAGPPVALRFENDLEGTFVPERTSISAAWIERERASGPVRSLPGLEIRGPLDPARDDLLRVTETDTRREAVVRFLPPVPAGAATDSWLRLVAALAGAPHPSLAPVIDGGVLPFDGGARRWIATLLVHGRPATARIAEGPQPLVTVARRARALAAGLHLLHSRGVVHGGLRPSNLLLRTDGSAVLIGLGRAHVRRDGAFAPGGATPEPATIAPELRTHGGLPTPASDVFGLATCVLAMATGRAPSAGNGAEASSEPPGALVGAEGPLPGALVELLAKGTADDPAQRPTAEDIGQSLAYFEATLPRQAP